MKRILELFTVSVIVGNMVGCGSDDPMSSTDLLAGTWIMVIDDEVVEITFHPDGTFINSDGDVMTWVLDGDQLTLGEDTGDDTATITVNETTLTLSGNEEGIRIILTFTRKE
jgi:hypothetical protein